jgi:site-specific DNA recombinase
MPDEARAGGSGGTMTRPALTRLLQEIRAGRGDLIVVYKVNRLTRALPDFARLAETFDCRRHELSGPN